MNNVPERYDAMRNNGSFVVSYLSLMDEIFSSTTAVDLLDRLSGLELKKLGSDLGPKYNLRF
jgi:hypothetical protein